MNENTAKALTTLLGIDPAFLHEDTGGRWYVDDVERQSTYRRLDQAMPALFEIAFSEARSFPQSVHRPPDILRFFRYFHLPHELREISRPFEVLARFCVSAIVDGPERSVALRKLLEAKDAAVRAALPLT